MWRWRLAGSTLRTSTGASISTLPTRNPHFTTRFSSSTTVAGNEENSRFGKNGRRAVSLLLISLTGGVALSALEDLAIYHACSSKAIELASQNKTIIDAIGEPVAKGPWYNATLAVAHKRQSVSCTFPVTGPQGSGLVHLKAVHKGDNRWLTFLRNQEWDILVMDAVLHIAGNNDEQHTVRVVFDNLLPSVPKESKEFNVTENQVIPNKSST